MLVKKIDWLDKSSREAILTINDNNGNEIKCFSQPCYLNIGDGVDEPLQCLNCSNIQISENVVHEIKKIGTAFRYEITGKLVSKDSGLVQAFDFSLHIDNKLLPNDIKDGSVIQFDVSRLDIW